MSGGDEEARARLPERFLEAAPAALEEAGVDGWLLYDLEGRNRVAAELLGLTAGTSRRHFVLVRPGARPAALVHRIERQSWEGWEGDLTEYVGWEGMEASLRDLLEGCERVAMEVSARDAVPFVDQVPAGVVELVEDCGPEVVGSASLISRTYAQWGEVGYRTHLRAARVLARAARDAYRRALRAAGSGDPLDEAALRGWVLDRLGEEGLGGGDAIVAAGPNTALPHYFPPERGSAELAAGRVFLLDLWGRAADEPDAVFADQTWMGVLGSEPPDGFRTAWEAVREARDRAVEFIAERHASGDLPTGAEVDRRARAVIEEHGFGEAFVHRTGHAMDRVNHGFGPNLDSVETRDERSLVEGIGFSVEPGVYFDGRWGIRSEINVHVTGEGPVVTTPDVQAEPWYADG